MVVPPCRRLWDPAMSRLSRDLAASRDGALGTPIRGKSPRDPQLGTSLSGTHTWVNHLRGPQDVARDAQMVFHPHPLQVHRGSSAQLLFMQAGTATRV